MIENIVITLFILEIIEIQWQKGDTLKSYLSSLLNLYNKNMILFFTLHPTIYFVTILSLYFEVINFYTLSILSVKLLDILFKISILKKITNHEDLGIFELYLQQDFQIPFLLKYFGVFLYPILLYLGMQSA